MEDLPSALRAAMRSAMPARTSGDSRRVPRSLLFPATTTRWGSQRMIFAPMATSESTKNMRPSNIFSKKMTFPSHCVATVMAMLMRSVG